ncbi:MAG: transglutaminase domain-containing protein [Clostridia bacterium]|nr:transglutaminase domain-containing protein [Clostridia bacterium]
MLYDKYQNKILKRASILRKLLRFLPLIIAVLCTAIAATLAVIFTKGIVYNVYVPSSVQYGKLPHCTASAFFSDVYFEYSLKGENTWSTETPVMPGEYDIRAVSAGSFGTMKYKEGYTLIIDKRDISLTLGISSVIYGETPDFRAELAFNDTLVCEGYCYENVMLENTTVWAEAEKIKIIDENGNDVTSAYNISTPINAVKILPRKITVVVEDAYHYYDGNEFRYEAYELLESSLAEGDVIQAKFEHVITLPGQKINKPVISIINKDGFDVTEHYDITTNSGKLIVSKRPLIVNTGSLTVVYDAEKHTSDKYTIGEGTSLLEGHKLVALNASSYTNAGDHENTMQFKVIDEATGSDVTRYYQIIVNNGTIKINKRPLKITTSSAVWLYDGMKHYTRGFKSEGLLSGHYATAARSETTMIMDVGTVENVFTVDVTTGRFNSTDFTENYEITYEYGTLEVRKRKITICTSSQTWVYDSLPHFSSEVEIKGDGLVDGHRITGTKLPIITEVGSVENKFVAEIVINLTKYTSNYEITYEYGTLTVEPRPITIAPVDAKKVYDGTPLYVTSAKITQGTLVTGHEITMETSGVATTVEESKTAKSRITSYNLTYNGEDVSQNYAITVEEGNITIEPRPIKVSSGSAEKIYDGTPLTNNEIVAIEDSEEVYSLVVGHKILGTVTGSQTFIGKGKNTYDINSVKIMNGEEDVTNNYFLHELATGTLLVKYPETIYGKVKANTSGPLYLRIASMGSYNVTLNEKGKLWNAAEPYFGETTSYNAMATTAISRLYSETYTAEFSDMQTYMQPYYSGVSNSSGIVIKTDTDYSDISVNSPYSVDFFKITNFYDKLEDIRESANLGTEELEYRKYVYENYLYIDMQTQAYMRNIIQKERLNANDDDIIQRVSNYIQNAARYDLYYDTALDASENVVIAFLDEYKTGNATHYASAATLLFRALGIPARYVEGFLVETVADNVVDITNPTHAWVEIYLDGIGWIHVEVTGGFDNGFDDGLYKGETLPEGFILQPLAYYYEYTGKLVQAENEVEVFGDLKKLVEMGYTYTVEISGSRIEMGTSDTTVKSFKLYDMWGNEVTDNFDIEYRNGKITIAENILRVYLHEINKYYDGKEITLDENGYTVMTPLPDGTEVSIRFVNPIVDAMEISRTELNLNKSDYIEYEIYRDGVDVTDTYLLCFDIHSSIINRAEYVPISIKKRQIEVAAGSAVKVYDDTPLESDDYFLSLGTLVEGDTLTAITDGEQTKEGKSENKIISATVIDKDGNNVTRNYKIIPTSGILTVIIPEE